MYQEILQLIEIAKRVDEEDVTEQWERDCEEMLHALQAKYKIMFQAIGARLPEFFNLHDYYEIMLYADWTFSKTFMELVHEMWDEEVFEDNDDAQVYS